MKKLIRIVIIVFILFFIGACAATTYQIKLKNGDTLEAKSEPVIDKASGYVEYLDKNDKKVRVKEEDVMIIMEK